jgi:hypothetical protein
VVVTHHVMVIVVHVMPVVAMGRGDAGHQSRRGGGQHDAAGGGLDERFCCDHGLISSLDRPADEIRVAGYEPGIRHARMGTVKGRSFGEEVKNGPDMTG